MGSFRPAATSRHLHRQHYFTELLLETARRSLHRSYSMPIKHLYFATFGPSQIMAADYYTLNIQCVDKKIKQSIPKL